MSIELLKKAEFFGKPEGVVFINKALRLMDSPQKKPELDRLFLSWVGENFQQKSIAMTIDKKHMIGEFSSMGMLVADDQSFVIVFVIVALESKDVQGNRELERKCYFEDGKAYVRAILSTAKVNSMVDLSPFLNEAIGLDQWSMPSLEYNDPSFFEPQPAGNFS